MRFILALFSSFILFTTTYAQESDSTTVDIALYDKYREDQFYVGATYNILNYKPGGLSQSGLSGGVHFGFIRDFPINKNRTYAIGIGVGLSFNSYNQNLAIYDVDNITQFKVIDKNEIDFTKNNFFANLIEVPIEFRWRNSTPTSYKFWRVYPGVKFGYVFSNGANFEGDLGNRKIKNSDVFEKLKYGVTLSTGYNTWNFHLYYGLSDMFDNQKTTSNMSLELSEIKVGLMFYLL